VTKIEKKISKIVEEKKVFKIEDENVIFKKIIVSKV
jgi:acetolactate synthase small subunit